MHRNILAMLLAGVIVLAFSLAPMLPGVTAWNLSGAAQAQKTDPTTNAKNLNTSRSNIYREETPGGTNPSTNKAKNLNTSRSNVNRMGGGGGKGAAGKATTVDGTKSNSDMKY